VEGGESLIASKHIPIRKLLSENSATKTTGRSASRSGRQPSTSSSKGGSGKSNNSNRINKDLALDPSLLHLGEGM
jgi:hypothetical protein